MVPSLDVSITQLNYSRRALVLLLPLAPALLWVWATRSPMSASIAPARPAPPPVSRRASQNQSDTSMDEHSSAPLSKPRPSSEPFPPRARGSHTSRHEPRRERSAKKPSKVTALMNWQRVMLAVLFLCGTIGTAVSFYLLPKESDGADAPGLVRGGTGGSSGAAGGTVCVWSTCPSPGRTSARASF